ncbi:hypothetical protein TWF694_000332 [Orbilia ellipsospora]|uniref:Nucleoside phosphorylase domain-containing protein n=1 Tax=Orbilia ellipsospora TaxID=2528407 RepID=A0AAV9XNM1_9PEZI
MPNAGDYTTAWICAIETEQTAAYLCLDEEHDDLDDVAANDMNCYTLGRVHQHNVVIATLPYGEYGECSATGVLKDMLRSFPNLRIGLMVGIGGGAPSSKHDIRLGDVVVSTPGPGHGGILQYDFGKSVQCHNFQMSQHLSPPPAILLSAINRLKSQYKIKGSPLKRTIDGILKENNEDIQQEYQRPDVTSDRLYLPEVVHPFENTAECSEICGRAV